MTLPKKTTRPGQEVEGEVELVLTIRKVVQACPPEVPPSLVAPAIGLSSLISLIASVKGPEVHPSLINLIAPVKGPEVHPNLISLIVPVKGSEVHPSLIIPVTNPEDRKSTRLNSSHVSIS